MDSPVHYLLLAHRPQLAHTYCWTHAVGLRVVGFVDNVWVKAMGIEVVGLDVGMREVGLKVGVRVVGRAAVGLEVGLRVVGLNVGLRVVGFAVGLRVVGFLVVGLSEGAAEGLSVHLMDWSIPRDWHFRWAHATD
jgi:hypothetical protein